MSLKVYKELEQGTDEWLQARCGVLTASVIGKMITPSTLKPSMGEVAKTMVRTLAAERISGIVEDNYPSHDMQRGTLLEPFARALYADHYQPVQEVGFMTRDDWGTIAGYSPDGLVGKFGLIEIKSPRAKTHVNTIIWDQPPNMYMAQLQMGLRVSGRDWIDYVSFCPGYPLYVKRVYRDYCWVKALDCAVIRAEEEIQRVIQKYESSIPGMVPTEWFDPFEEQEIQVF